jgi:crossover junction endodeoxyribonuclease RuvC
LIILLKHTPHFMSIFLGIDPGTTTVGYGVIEVIERKPYIVTLGVIHTTPGLGLALKLIEMGHDLETLLRTYKPDAAAVERLFFGTNITTAIDVAHGRGVILHALASHGIPTQEINPMQVKKGICGNGRAPKSQVQNALKLLFGLTEIPRPDDAADALAIAYIGSLAPLPK